MTLEEARMELDRIDAQLAALFDKRMGVIDQVARIKRDSGAPVHDPARERQVTERLVALTGTKYPGALAALYQAVFTISRDYQARMLGGA